MNTTELINDYREKGWKIDESTLRKVSAVAGAEKYDISVVSPDNAFSVVQIVIKDEEAFAEGIWSDKIDSFGERLKVFVRNLEVNDIFAISINQVVETDLVAIVSMYSGSTDVVLEKGVIRERDGVLSLRKIL